MVKENHSWGNHWTRPAHAVDYDGDDGGQLVGLLHYVQLQPPEWGFGLMLTELAELHLDAEEDQTEVVMKMKLGAELSVDRHCHMMVLTQLAWCRLKLEPAEVRMPLMKRNVVEGWVHLSPSPAVWQTVGLGTLLLGSAPCGIVASPGATAVSDTPADDRCN